jgi:WD40 repeat protein
MGANGNEELNLKEHTEPVNAVAWSPNGIRLASGSKDQMVRLWAADGLPGPVLKGHTGEVLGVAWSPDGKRLASASRDTTVRLWSVDGTAGPVLDGKGMLHSVAWSPDGKRLAGAGKGVQLWQSDGKEGPFLKGHPLAVLSVAWSPDSRWLASAGSDQTVRLWQADGTPGAVLLGHTGGVNGVAWSGGRSALGRPRSVAGLVGLLAAPRNRWPLLASAALLRGTTIASCGAESTVRVWDGDTAEPRLVIVAATDEESVAFSAAGQLWQGDTAVVEQEFVYVVEQDGGRLELLKPSEFLERYAADR